jgi:hypothetical protein
MLVRAATIRENAGSIDGACLAPPEHAFVRKNQMVLLWRAGTYDHPKRGMGGSQTPAELAIQLAGTPEHGG